MQITSGWCSPTIANVVGNVTVNCIGVSKKAHEKLNRELQALQKKSKLQVEELVAKAELWVQRYNQLKQSLESIVTTDSTIAEINRLILEGDLDLAAQQLDTILQAQNKAIASAAEANYLRASVYILEFNVPKALSHLQYAHSLNPKRGKYLLAYTSMLIESGDYARAESVVKDNLAHLRTRTDQGSTRDAFDLINALDKLSTLYILTSRENLVPQLSDEMINVLRRVQMQGETSDEFTDMAVATAFAMGRNSLVTGDFVRAEEFLKLGAGQGLGLCTDGSAQNCDLSAKSFNLLGWLHFERGNYNTAQKHLELSNDLQKLVDTDDNPAYLAEKIKTRYLLAESLLMQKKAEAARVHWEEMVRLWESVGQPHMLVRQFMARAYIKTAEFAGLEKRYSEAEKLLNSALDLTRPDGDVQSQFNWALAQIVLSHVYLSQNRTADAYNHAREAHTIITELWKREPQAYIESYERYLFLIGTSAISVGHKQYGCDSLDYLNQVGRDAFWRQQGNLMYQSTCP